MLIIVLAFAVDVDSLVEIIIIDASIPITTITINSSTSVKPLCLFIISPLAMIAQNRASFRKILYLLSLEQIIEQNIPAAAHLQNHVASKQEKE